jgi:hypothetical protein
MATALPNVITPLENELGQLFRGRAKWFNNRDVARREVVFGFRCERPPQVRFTEEALEDARDVATMVTTACMNLYQGHHKIGSPTRADVSPIWTCTLHRCVPARLEPVLRRTRRSYSRSRSGNRRHRGIDRTMTTTITIDPKFTATAESSSVECQGDALEHVFDPAKLAGVPATAIRDAIAADIRSSPTRDRRGGQAWNKSGHLAQDMTVEQQPDGTFAVVTPPDRLQDPDVQQRFADAIAAAHAPLENQKVQAAIAATTASIVKKA